MFNRSACTFPDHHGAVRSAGSVVLAVVAVLAGLAVLAAVRFVTAYFWWFAVPATAAVALRFGLAAVRFARLDQVGKRHWFLCRWHRLGWKRLARNLQLALPDRHRGGIDSSLSKKVNYPRRVRFRPDAFGWTVALRPSPGVTREDVEKQAEALADRWRCVRVGVSKPAPGKLVLRACRRDPLGEAFSVQDAPSGAFGRTVVSNPLRLYMGLDSFARHRWISLPGCTGVTVAGLPGRGKTTLVESWLQQLDPLPSRFAIVDGKSSHLLTSDYADWSDRAWILTGDDLESAADALNECYREMRRRFAMVLELTGGKKNAWHVGPTEAMPLLFVVLDEVRTFFDEQAVKGDPKAAAQVRACRSLAGHLVGKGRSVLVVTVTLSQKQDALATNLAVRDSSGISVAFGLRTVDAAVSALGADIRTHESVSPVLLQADEYIGCCVASLPSGMVPYTALRVPALAPRVLPVAVPADARELVG